MSFDVQPCRWNFTGSKGGQSFAEKTGPLVESEAYKHRRRMSTKFRSRRVIDGMCEAPRELVQLSELVQLISARV